MGADLAARQDEAVEQLGLEEKAPVDALPLGWPGVEVASAWGRDTDIRIARFRGSDTVPYRPWVVLTADGGGFHLQTYLDAEGVQALIDGLTAWVEGGAGQDGRE